MTQTTNPKVTYVSFSDSIYLFPLTWRCFFKFSLLRWRTTTIPFVAIVTTQSIFRPDWLSTHSHRTFRQPTRRSPTISASSKTFNKTAVCIYTQFYKQLNNIKRRFRRESLVFNPEVRGERIHSCFAASAEVAKYSFRNLQMDRI